MMCILVGVLRTGDLKKLLTSLRQACDALQTKLKHFTTIRDTKGVFFIDILF